MMNSDINRLLLNMSGVVYMEELAFDLFDRITSSGQWTYYDSSGRFGPYAVFDHDEGAGSTKTEALTAKINRKECACFDLSQLTEDDGEVPGVCPIHRGNEDPRYWMSQKLGFLPEGTVKGDYIQYWQEWLRNLFLICRVTEVALGGATFELIKDENGLATGVKAGYEGAYYTLSL